MSVVRSAWRSPLAVSSLLITLALALAAPALGEELADEGGAFWQLEQPVPPAGPSGAVEAVSPIGLGAIGDVEFWAPNRGVLITSGNPPTIAPGLWAYNGRAWHQLSTVCGASDGRIAWAGSEELWTISDGRPGQVGGETGSLPPLADNTLCRFAGGLKHWMIRAEVRIPRQRRATYDERPAAAIPDVLLVVTRSPLLEPGLHL